MTERPTRRDHRGPGQGGAGWPPQTCKTTEPGLYSMEETHVEKKWLGTKTEQEKENKDDANKK